MVTTEKVAVVGISCTFPGGDSPSSWWSFLETGAEGVADAETLDAFDAWRLGAPRGGLIDAVTDFDAAFFRISPREARAMDPQQRILLQSSWKLLEDARITDADRRANRIAVYVGAMSSDYSALAARSGRVTDRHTLTSTARSLLANRLSHALGLGGESLTVDTGQSSSLAAVHLAASAVARGDTDIALAGGVNLILDPQGTETAGAFGALSPDGRCFTMDERANGYVRGEGVGLIALKSLSRADGDRIYCVIDGSAMRSDGADDALTVPARAGQARTFRAAYENAGVDPATIEYVELHGTGTAVGDPIEAHALGEVLGTPRRAAGRDPLRVGSVKTVIGHLEGAAGIAGFIRTALAIHHGVLPRSANFVTPNPAAALHENHLAVQVTPEIWAGPGRRAAVSAFGMGGTNVHVVLSAVPAQAEEAAAGADDGSGGAPSAPDATVVPLLLSGPDDAALAQQARTWHDWLSGRSDRERSDAARISLLRPRLGRTAVIAEPSTAGCTAELAALADSIAGPSTSVLGQATGDGAGAGSVSWVFSGQGTQRAGAGAGLYSQHPVFAKTVDRITEAFTPLLGVDLRRYLLAEPDSPLSAELTDTRIAQAAVFTVQSGLAALLGAYGARPDSVTGHSVGEYAAAVVAGVMSEADAVYLVAHRGLLMSALPSGGGMVSLRADADAVAELLGAGDTPVEIAAVNAADNIVLSGESGAIAEVIAAAATRGISAKPLRVSHAFHSRAMDPVLAPFREHATAVTLAEPTIPFVSTVSGRAMTTELADPEYWVQQIRQLVAFHAAVTALAQAGTSGFIEIGPQSSLTAVIGETVPDATAVIPVLHHSKSEQQTLSTALGVHAVTTGTGRRTYELLRVHGQPLVEPPTYEFDRRRYWAFDAETSSAETDPGAAVFVGSPAPDAHARPEPTADHASSDDPDVVPPKTVRAALAAVLGADAGELDLTATFTALGLDSMGAVELVQRLQPFTSTRLTPSVVFDHPTPASLIAYLGSTDGAAETSTAAIASTAADDPVVVIAMDCLLPGGADGPAALWRLLIDEVDAIGPFPDDRDWNTEGLFADDPSVPGTSYAREGGFLEAASTFDPAFFGLSPREATAMDPQQRLLLQLAHRAWERAGLTEADLRGSDTGVFVGAMAQPYGPPMDSAAPETEGYLLTGVSPSVLSGRIAYHYGLTGPALTVDTACSSSLVAVHLAAQAIRSGACSLALAGGVTVMPTPGMFVELSRQQALSPSARCRAFSADADGTGWGEGAGLVLLTRASIARTRGIPVLAVIEGSAINQDGASNGLTAPSGTAQQRVIDEATRAAGVDLASVDAVEAHGTGTKLGDPIEANALIATYGQRPDTADPLWLGSLKSNVGHSQAAAGVVGLIKMVLALGAERLPRTLHVTAPSPFVDWSAGRVELLTEPRPWPVTPGRTRRAGISSFGISGTNAHLILAEPTGLEADDTAATALPAPANPGADRLHLLAVTAPDAAALSRRCTDLADFLEGAATDLGDLAAVLATTRTHWAHRVVVLAADTPTAVAALRAAATGDPFPGCRGIAAPGETTFVFPGQGAQWPGMAAGLIASEPVFEAELRRADAVIAELAGWSVIDVLTGAPGAPDPERIDVIQPVLFATMISLGALWRSYGVRPDTVIGHSQGEVAAAYFAGALSLRDAATVIVVRSRVSRTADGTGGMLSILAPRAEVATLLRESGAALDIAAVNSSRSTTVAGLARDLDTFAETVAAAGFDCRRIPGVTMAGHSRVCEPLREDLLAGLQAIRPRPASVEMLSTVTAAEVDGAALDADYWYRNLRETVDFHGASLARLAQGRSVFIEVSTHPLLVNALSTTIEESSAAGAGVGTLSRGAGDRATFLLALAQAFVSGVPADLRTRDADGDPLGFRDRGLPARLPAYPFARTRLWLPATPAGAVDAAALGGSDVAGPLVTARLHTPGAGGEVFTGRIAVDDPAAAVGLLVELALEAGDEAGYGLLARLDVTGPLPPARECIAQVHLAEVGGERTAFTIHVRSTGGEDDWVQAAEGELRDSPAVATVPDPLPASATVDPELVTGTVHTGGAGPDESPVSIAAVRRGPEALDVDLDLPDDSDHPDSAAAILAPALLGAAGTLAGHLLDPDGAAAPLAVLRVEGLGSLLQGVRAVRIALRMRGGTESGAVVDMTITDRTGAPVTPTATLTLGTPTTMAASASEARRTMYVVDWRDAAPHDVAVGTGQERGPEPYLVPDGTDATAPQRAREVTKTVLERLREHLAADDPEAVLAIHTRHAVVTGLEHEEANPVHAAVWGLVRSAQTETPGRFVLIDSDGHPDSAAAVSAAGRAGHPQVAVRAGRLCLPRLRRYSEHPSDSPRPANNGTVLVTGATGGLGRMVAEHLVREHGVRDLVLVSRGGPRSSGADELIANLIDLGARPELVACDAADRDAIAEVIAGITAHRPPLRAVIHTAGVLDDATIANLTREKIDAVFRAKVDALEHLDELTADLDLDYFLVYSSMVASFGNPGQANYAAANAYMESLISRRRRRGLAGTAIGWGYWATDSAMSAHLSELDISRIRRTGVIPLGADQGMAVVDTLLAAPGQDTPPAVLAVPFDPTVITSRATDPELSPLIRSLAPPSRRRAVATRTTTGTALQRLLARALPAEWRRLTAELVRTQVRTVLGTAPDSPLDGGRALRDIGFDSLTSVELRNRLAAETGLALPTTLVFDHPTPDHLTDYLLRQVADDEEAPDGVDDAVPDRPDASPRSLDDDPIVIVSMACRLPGGVRSADDLWNLVAHGRHGIGPFPEDRGWPAELYHADPAAKGHSYTRHGGFIYDAAEFDAGFFGMSPREALATDPQHRLMLETVWEALEEAAIDPHSLRGANVGVYIGSVGQDYVHLGDRVDESLEGFLVTGRASSVLSGRVSYTFGFEGPAITVDTACSSSLVALHLAVTALRRDECEMAVVGGVSIMADPGLFIEFSRQRGLAADGHCKTFSDQADGTAWAEGIGVLLVERRSHALRYGHRILAEVSGTAINQDGASNGLTAPSGPAQRRVIAAALADAGVAPSEIDLVEAHGTGTPLGDPIEAGALIEAYGEHRDGAAPLYVGALKTNTGHTQGAAGIAGVIKTVLALRHQLMPRSLWGRNRSSAVTWQGVELLPDERPWPHGERRRRAGVSAFGISGTNAHVIVSEPVVPSDAPHRAPEGAAPEELGLTVWPVSADDPDALSVLLESVPHALEHTADPADAGAALTTGRAQLTHRAVLLPGEPEPIARGAVTDADTVFVFSGQGGQWLDMGRALAEASPTFASALDDVCAAVDRYLDRPIRDIMWHSDSGDSGTDVLLDDTRYSQPAIFAIQVALLRLVEALGLRPDAVIGHSVGEVAAAHAAGILGLDAAARFIAARGTQMSAAPAGGAMAAIAAPPDRVHGLITRDASPDHGTDPVVIAAINGPAAVTVSGSAAAVAAAVDAATAAGIRTKTLQVSHAFHSAQMAAAAHGLAGVADEIDFQKPRIPFLPTGGRSRAVHTPAYWTEQVTAPVDFLGAVNEAAERGPARYLVLGPDSALVAALREATNGSVATALMSPKTGTTAQGAARDAATALSRLWADGAPVTWLLQTYGAAPARRRPLLLGSFKSNVGHSAAAAGVAGLIKMTLALTHGSLPRTLHVDAPSTKVDWSQGAVELLTAPRPWSATPGRRRRAGISAFGASGTNAHVIVADAPPVPEPTGPDPEILSSTGVGRGALAWPLSARSAAALPAQAQALLTEVDSVFAADHPDDDVARERYCADLALSLAGRTQHPHRVVITGGPARLRERLAGLARSEAVPEPGVVAVDTARDRLGPVFVFPGQGGQWAGMAAGLLRDCPAFAHRWEQCAEALAPHVDFDLSDTVADPEGAWLEDVSRVQPILWATMVSLAEVWAAAGVRPAAVIGHSQGEIAAACVIGALSLADGARLVATRSRLLTRLSGRGGMLALGANREEALRRLIPGVQLAAENGAGSVVLAGAADALRRYADTAEADGIRTRMIPVDYASHSEQVDEIATALTAATGDIVARDAPDSEFYSTVAGRTGEPIATEALGGGYWFENLRNTVEFATAVRRAITDGYGLFIEISPHPLLLTAIGETADTLGGADDVAVVGTLARDRGGLDQIWYSLGQVHAAGGAVDWARALAAYAPRIVDLPTYRFSTRRYWLPDGRAALNRYAPNPIGSVDEWRYRVAYLPVAASTGSLPGTVTVITDHHRTGAADALRAAGAAVTTCRIGEWRTDAPAADASLVLLGGEAELTAHGSAQSVPPALAEAFELVSRHIRGPALPLWFAGDESAPDVAAAFALIRVAALEFPNHIGGTVDLPDGALDADRLLAALGGEHDQVSLRTPSAGEIGVRRLLAGPFPGSGPRTGDWTPRGTVLITGATGGIGGQLTRWLAARGAPRMILLSRRGEAAPGAADLADELAAAGAQPRIVAADASDTDALVRIRDEYAAAGTPITSVFHLAGGGTLADLIDTDAAEFAATAHAKIDGARALDAVFPDVEDFVLFSSISAVWGSGSHGAYASANAYLDALARGRRAAGRAAVSIVWGIWDPADGGGMAANLVREQLAARGIPFMDPSRSLRELGAVLGGDPQPVEVIAAVDWERFLPVFTSARSSGLFNELPRGGVPDAGESRSGGELPDLARRVLDLPDRERDAVVSDVVRDTIAAVLRLDPGEVDTERAFRDVGIDSLTAIDTRNRLRAATGIPLPVTMVFDHPTVTALARYITGRLLEGSEEPTAPSVDRTAPSPGRGTSVDLTTPADDLLDVDEMDIADLIRAANDAEEAAR